MKTSIAFFLIFLLGLGMSQTFAQTENKSASLSVEQNAQFPGGINAFYQYLAEKLNSSENDGFGIQGKLICSFVVDADGSIKDVKIVEGFSQGHDEEVIKALNNSPKWNPAIQNGQPVRQEKSLPVFITL